jgi:GMP reductase
MPHIETEVKLDFKDVLFRPKRSSLTSRNDVMLTREYKFANNLSWSGIPIMVANMDTVGTFKMALACSKYKMITCIHKHYSVADWENFTNSLTASELSDIVPYIVPTFGVELKNIHEILSVFPATMICLDVANGYTEAFVNVVQTVKTMYPNKILIAGNVVTSEMVEQLIVSGADIVKCGIGSGSVCTTRKQTGVGYPQLSAVIECADAAHGLNGRIISDGGCTCPGDFAKAFGGGADFVMSGGFFAAHDECNGSSSDDDSSSKYSFYGMSSEEAMNKYSGGVSSYRSSEGKCVSLASKGPVEGTIFDLLGGIRSACTYTGSKTLKELPKRTTFIRVTQQLNDVYK